MTSIQECHNSLPFTHKQKHVTSIQECHNSLPFTHKQKHVTSVQECHNSLPFTCKRKHVTSIQECHNSLPFTCKRKHATSIQECHNSLPFTHKRKHVASIEEGQSFSCAAAINLSLRASWRAYPQPPDWRHRTCQRDVGSLGSKDRCTTRSAGPCWIKTESARSQQIASLLIIHHSSSMCCSEVMSSVQNIHQNKGMKSTKVARPIR